MTFKDKNRTSGESETKNDIDGNENKDSTDSNTDDTDETDDDDDREDDYDNESTLEKKPDNSTRSQGLLADIPEMDDYDAENDSEQYGECSLSGAVELDGENSGLDLSKYDKYEKNPANNYKSLHSTHVYASEFPLSELNATSNNNLSGVYEPLAIRTDYTCSVNNQKSPRLAKI